MYAQYYQTEFEIDQWTEMEMKRAQVYFQFDSANYVRSRKEDLIQTQLDIEKEAARLKRRLNNRLKRRLKRRGISHDGNEANDVVLAVVDDTIVSTANSIVDSFDDVNASTPQSIVERGKEQDTSSIIMDKTVDDFLLSLKNDSQNYLDSLNEEDPIYSTRAFINDFLSFSDDISQYLPIENDLIEMNNLLKQCGLYVVELNAFIDDLKVVEFADSVLKSPYKKETRIDAQNKLKSVKFRTDGQIKCSYVNSLLHGLSIYYLSTSNMMDLIDEIIEHQQRYLVSKTDDEKNEITEDMRSCIEFDARVDNFRSVKYMSDIYDKIIHDVIFYDEEGRIVFEKFNMDSLKTIKKDLEYMRKQ